MKLRISLVCRQVRQKTDESSLGKKTVSFKDFFQTSQNLVREKKGYKTRIVIQNSATKCYPEFHLRPHKDLEMLILVASFLLLTKVIL